MHKTGIIIILLLAAGLLGLFLFLGVSVDSEIPSPPPDISLEDVGPEFPPPDPEPPDISDFLEELNAPQ